jgi:rhamnosyltransferase subunit B
MADPALWHPRTSFRTLWAVIAPTLQPHFHTLVSLANDDTVLVGTLWAFSARLMQELYRVPLVSVQVSPSTLLSAHAPPTHPRLTIPRGLPLGLKSALLRLIERQVLDKVCGPALNALRAQLGLAPVTRIFGQWLHSTDGALCLFPEWFAQPQPDWPEPHRLSGFPLFNDISEPLPDAQLDAFLAAGERPVVFTAGSTLIDHERYAGAVSGALRESGRFSRPHQPCCCCGAMCRCRRSCRAAGRWCITAASARQRSRMPQALRKSSPRSHTTSSITRSGWWRAVAVCVSTDRFTHERLPTR